MPPVIHLPRKVPVALRPLVWKELKRMKDLGIISNQIEPTNWVSSMVTVAKKGKNLVRICLDPSDLNKAIKQPHYPMKTVEDIVDNLTDAKYFSTLDCNSGFWQLPLDNESATLLTFNTPEGRHRFYRLPFGTSQSGEMFQSVMSEIFGDIVEILFFLCVEILVDDILIWAPNIEIHDQRLKSVLKAM